MSQFMVNMKMHFAIRMIKVLLFKLFFLLMSLVIFFNLKELVPLHVNVTLKSLKITHMLISFTHTLKNVVLKISEMVVDNIVLP